MSVVDHPLRQTTELNGRIQAEFGEWACWRATIDMGMIVFLDFGERLNLLGKKGPVTIGALRLLVHSESWVVERDGAVGPVSDEVLDDEDEASLEIVFVGRRLHRLDWSANTCRLTFSEGVIMKIDRASEAPERDTLVEFRFANGDFVDCMANGAIETERSDE